MTRVHLGDYINRQDLEALCADLYPPGYLEDYDTRRCFDRWMDRCEGVIRIVEQWHLPRGGLTGRHVIAVRAR